MVAVSDPVGLGVINNLPHPGVNLTGVSNNTNELTAKQMQFLTELRPDTSAIAVIRNSLNPQNAALFWEAESVAPAMKITLRSLPIGSENLQNVLEASINQNPGGLLVVGDPLTIRFRRSIIDFANRQRIPAVYTYREDAAEGGLLVYGPDLVAVYHRAATYVDKIIKAPIPPICPWSSRRFSIWSSPRKPLRRSGWRFRPRSSPGPTR
jgi:putative ABC transport system substrate-binding protein